MSQIRQVTKLQERRKLNINEKYIKKDINPKIIPRNHIVEKILNESENNNFSNLYKLLKNLNNPYENDIHSEFKKMPSEEEKIHETFCGT